MSWRSSAHPGHPLPSTFVPQGGAVILESHEIHQVLEPPAAHSDARPDAGTSGPATVASMTNPSIQADAAAYAMRLVVRRDEKAQLVKLTDVDFFQSAANYVVIHIRGDQYRVRFTLRSLLPRLDPAQFARIHKSTVVNLDRIKEIQPWFGGDHVAILLDGRRLRVSRTYARQLLRPVQ